MPGQEYGVHVKTTETGSEKLDKLRQRIDRAKVKTEQLRQAQEKASRSQKQFAAAQQGGAKAAEQLGAAVGGSTAQIVGAFAAGGPIAGAALVIFGLIKMYRDWRQEIADTIKVLSSSGEETERVNKQVEESTARAATAAREHAAALEFLAGRASDANTELDRQIDLAAQLAKAEAEAALAAVDVSEASGAITGEQAIRQRAGINANLRGQERDLVVTEAERRAEIEAEVQRELSARLSKLGGERDRLSRAEPTATPAAIEERRQALREGIALQGGTRGRIARGEIRSRIDEEGNRTPLELGILDTAFGSEAVKDVALRDKANKPAKAAELAKGEERLKAATEAIAAERAASAEALKKEREAVEKSILEIQKALSASRSRVDAVKAAAAAQTPTVELQETAAKLQTEAAVLKSSSKGGQPAAAPVAFGGADRLGSLPSTPGGVIAIAQRQLVEATAEARGGGGEAAGRALLEAVQNMRTALVSVNRMNETLQSELDLLKADVAQSQAQTSNSRRR